MKDVSTQHPTYLQDTPDFLRKIEEINSQGILPNNAMIATWDVMSLFTIIPQDEGVQAWISSTNAPHWYRYVAPPLRRLCPENFSGLKPDCDNSFFSR